MIKKIVNSLLCVILFVTLTGCASMTMYEKTQYETLKYRLAKVGLPVLEEKTPIIAGALNLLPGIGNIYLGQWGVFIGNLLFWPWSALWGVPQAYIDAETLNKEQTLSHYTYGMGKETLEKAEAIAR